MHHGIGHMVTGGCDLVLGEMTWSGGRWMSPLWTGTTSLLDRTSFPRKERSLTFPSPHTGTTVNVWVGGTHPAGMHSCTRMHCDA